MNLTSPNHSYLAVLLCAELPISFLNKLKVSTDTIRSLLYDTSFSHSNRIRSHLSGYKLSLFIHRSYGYASFRLKAFAHSGAIIYRLLSEKLVSEKKQFYTHNFSQANHSREM